MKQLTLEEIGRLDPTIDDVIDRHPVRVVAENIRSAHNVGSLIRTSDALLLSHVHLTGYSADGNHRGVNKAALGAQDTVPWTHEEDTLKVIERLKTEGHTIAAVEITDKASRLDDLTRDHFPLVLVVGNEVNGVSDDVLAQCDFALELPQFGYKHSLNVAVAFAVMGYDVIRKWIELTDRH